MSNLIKIIASTEEDIKKWANTSRLLKREGVIMVKHYVDGLYHYFISSSDGKYIYAMNSVKPYYEESNG